MAVQRGKIYFETMKREHIGSDFDGFLQADGLLAECEAGALKRVGAWQIEREKKRRKTFTVQARGPHENQTRDPRPLVCTERIFHDASTHGASCAGPGAASSGLNLH